MAIWETATARSQPLAGTKRTTSVMPEWGARFQHGLLQSVGREVG